MMTNNYLEAKRFLNTLSKLLNLSPTQEYDPQSVLDRILAFVPEAKITKEMVIRRFGVRKT